MGGKTDHALLSHNIKLKRFLQYSSGLYNNCMMAAFKTENSKYDSRLVFKVKVHFPRKRFRFHPPSDKRLVFILAGFK